MQLSLYSRVNVLKSRLLRGARRVLSQDQRNRLKKWQGATRTRWRKLYLLAYGQYTAHELVGQLRTRLADDFEILVVHSAYDRLLPMYSGKPQEIIDELIKLCGPSRTLVMPAFVLGGRSYDPIAYYRSRVFDARRTVSEVGFVAEIFRRMPGVKRSLHPTHSICALGPLADSLTATHHLASTRTGRGTPFETMAQRRTTIVGLGIEYFRSLTQSHTAEDMLGAEFPVRFSAETLPVTVVDQSGTRSVYDLTVEKAPTIFDVTVLRSLLSEDELIEWKYRGTTLFVTYADKVTSRLIAAAREGITVYGPVQN